MDKQAVWQFDIQGMHCASCVARIESLLAKQPEIARASANLATEQVRVEFVSTPAPARVIETLTKAGFSVPLQREQLAISGMHCAACVGRIEKILLKQAGVINAQVNLVTEQALVEGVNLNPEQLIAAITRAGFGAQPISHSTQPSDTQQAKQSLREQQLQRQFFTALLLALPVFVLEMGGHVIPALHHFLLEHVSQQQLWLTQFVLTTLLLLLPGRQILTNGLQGLARGQPDMNALVTLGAGAAYLYSCVSTFWPTLLPAANQHVYFESSAVIITLILLGRRLEARAKGRSSQAIEQLLGLQEKQARRWQDGEYHDVAIESIKLGDQLLVRPGERIPLDAIVLSGESYVDESMISGEATPVAKRANDKVIGGTINQFGALTLQVSAVGQQTTLAQIIQLVQNAQASKLPIQQQVDRITAWFVPAVLLLALLTLGVWWWLADLQSATIHAVAVLIIACPCAMGLATPVSLLVASGRAAQLGVLFRKNEALQRLGECRQIAFDKTGTLTQGKPVVTDVLPAAGVSAEELLTRAASVEQHAEHPLAKAVVAQAQGLQLPLATPANFQAITGQGVQAEFDGKIIRIGNAAFIGSQGADVSALQTQAQTLARAGKTPIYIASGQQLLGAIAIADPIKPTTATALNSLREQGIQLAMITGDNELTAARVAAELGINTTLANVLPQGKVQALQTLQQQGPVVFVGDGINDAPALAQADVGVAVGDGTDIAIESADVVIINGNLQALVQAHGLSQATMRNIKQNLFWAFGYNSVLIPIAAGVLVPIANLSLSPVMAAAAMALSSLFVLGNALRLRRYRANV